VTQKKSRAGVWQSRTAFVEKAYNGAYTLTRISLQWINDVYDLVLSPNSQLNKNTEKIEKIEQLIPIDQEDSTAASSLDGTIPGVETAVTQLQSDFNELLSKLRET